MRESEERNLKLQNDGETQGLEGKWKVRYINNRKNGQEGEWKSLDQIQGEQTLLTNNLFGMTFRIIPIGDGKYRISEFSVSPLNIYDRLMEEAGMDIEEAYEEIETELENGEWTATNVRGLMDYGVIEGICRRLDLQDEDNYIKTNTRREFLDNNNDIAIMGQLEWNEYYFYKPDQFTAEERLELLKEKLKKSTGDGVKHSADMLMYKKYEEIVREKQKSKTYGAESILEYMKKHNLTVHDLSLALTMLVAGKSGVKGVEGNILNESLNNPEKRNEQNQI